MKRNDLCTGVVERVDYPGKGILTANGTACEVKNVMPGQEISFRVKKKKNGRWQGNLLDVLAPSTLETRKPVCSLFPKCGGCMYQTMAYEEQLSMKYEQVKRLLMPALKTQTGSEAAAESLFKGIDGSPSEFCYRNKMEFSFGDSEKDGPLTLGLHQKNSNYNILPVTDCAIVHPDFNVIVTAVQAFFRASGNTYYHKMSHTGGLRSLLVRRTASTGEILTALVASTQEKYDLEGFKNLILGLPLEGTVTGILFMENDSVADVVQSQRTEILYGRDTIREEMLGLSFEITPFSFFQTNTKGAEVLYQTAGRMIGDVDNATAFDLYSGTGTIAQMLSKAAGRVIGVEIVAEAVEAARKNASVNGISNCEFIAGDVLKVLDDIDVRPDFLVLDPPRDGIHPDALSKIIAYQADRIVYISCKPTSLARDLAAFLSGGYEVQEIRCVDMFPETVHIETVCCLYHQKKEFISVPYEPKNMSDLIMLK